MSDERRPLSTGWLTALSWAAACVLAGVLGALAARSGRVSAWAAGAATGAACSLPLALLLARRRNADRPRDERVDSEQDRRDARVEPTQWTEAIERLRELEAQLRQAQRMESLGRLAAGIAHDFNNLLTAMIGYTEVAMRKLGPAHEGAGDLDEIRRVAARAGDLTRQLLAFSRRQGAEPKVVELDGIVLGLERMLRRVLGEHVELVVEAESAPARVEIDSAQLEQVLMNLAVNARDAMPNGGRLEISTAALALDVVARNGAEGDGAEIPDGAYVSIAVSDTGAGIAPDVLPHIFEPFYTTKREGHGTGLGLAIAQSAVRAAGGRLRVESRVGHGTRFTILLPQCGESRSEIPRPAEPATSPAGRETVLLVEDEPDVRRIASDELRSRGYRVLEAADGVEALSVARSFANEIHCLLADLVLPRLGGHELSERLRAERPG